MRPKRASITIVLAAVAIATVTGLAQSKNPFAGTWRLDTTKSKYDPGPAPKSQTAVYEAAGQGYKVTVNVEPATGAAQQWSYTTSLDGKDAPVTGSNPNADTLASKRIDANTIETVSKKGGKVTVTQRNVVAPDGKTRTVTSTGTDGQGRKVNNVTVFVKQ